MGMRSGMVMAAILAGVLATSAARAHVVVLPDESEASGWERYTVIVPTEKDSPTVRVQVVLPVGMEVVAVESKPGWSGAYNPFPLGAATVQWQGGQIPKNEFMSFEFLAWNPPKARTVSWVATQWFADGSSHKWGGKGDEAHASTTVLKPGKGKKGHRHHGH